MSVFVFSPDFVFLLISKPAFEFTEQYLILIADALYSRCFTTFLGNSESERMVMKGTSSNLVMGHVSVIPSFEEMLFQVETDEHDSDSEAPSAFKDFAGHREGIAQLSPRPKESPYPDRIGQSLSLWEYIDNFVDRNSFVNRVYVRADSEVHDAELEMAGSFSDPQRRCDGFIRGLKPSTDPRVWPLW